MAARSHVAVALVLVAGCASWIDEKAGRSTLRIVEASIEAGARTRDIELAREAMPSGILQLDAFAIAYPRERKYRVMHADALCQYATAFLFDDWEAAALAGKTDDAARIAERVEGALDTCVDAQLALLPPPWRGAYAKGLPAFVELLPGLTKDTASPVLWIATARSLRIALAPLANIAALPDVTAILARTSAVAPGLDDARAEILLGTLDAGVASVFPGKPDGGEHFTRARSLAGAHALDVEVMFARGVAVARKDRALFTTTLERVVATDLERWPERRLANAMARRKAARYLTAIDTLIPAAR